MKGSTTKISATAFNTSTNSTATSPRNNQQLHFSGVKMRQIPEGTWNEIEERLVKVMDQNDQLNRSITEKIQENERLRATIEILHKTNSELSNLTQSVERSYTQELDRNRKELEATKKYVVNLEKELQESSNDQATWKSRYLSLEKQVNSMIATEKDVLEYLPLKSAHASLTERTNELTKELASKLKEGSKLQQELKSSKQQETQAISECESLKLKNSSLEKSIKEARRQITRLESSLENQQTWAHQTQPLESSCAQFQQPTIQISDKLNESRVSQSKRQNPTAANNSLTPPSQQSMFVVAIDATGTSDDENNPKSVRARAESTSPISSLNNSILRKSQTLFNPNVSNNHTNNLMNNINNNMINSGSASNLNPIVMPQSNTQTFSVLDNLDKKYDMLLKRRSRKLSQPLNIIIGSTGMLETPRNEAGNRSMISASSFVTAGAGNNHRKNTGQTDEFEDILLTKNHSFSSSKSPRNLTQNGNTNNITAVNNNNNNNTNDDKSPSSKPMTPSVDRGDFLISGRSAPPPSEFSRFSFQGDISDDKSRNQNQNQQNSLKNTQEKIKQQSETNKNLLLPISKKLLTQVGCSSLESQESKKELAFTASQQRTFEQLLQQRYQQQQEEEESQQKINQEAADQAESNVKDQYKKRLSFQKELQIQVYKNKRSSDISPSIESSLPSESQQDETSSDDENVTDNQNENLSEASSVILIENRNTIIPSLRLKTTDEPQKTDRSTKESNSSTPPLSRLLADQNTSQKIQVFNLPLQHKVVSNDPVLDHTLQWYNQKNQEIESKRIQEEQDKKESYLRRVESIETEKVYLVRLLQKKQEEFEEIHREEVEILEAKIEELSSLFIAESRKVQESERQAAFASATIQSLESKVISLQQSIVEYEKKVTQLKQQVNEKRDAISQMEQEMSDLLQTNETLTESLRSLNEQHQNSFIQSPNRHPKPNNDGDNFISNSNSNIFKKYQQLQEQFQEVRKSQEYEMHLYQQNLKRQYEEELQKQRKEMSEESLQEESTIIQLKSHIEQDSQEITRLKKQLEEAAEIERIMEQKNMQLESLLGADHGKVSELISENISLVEKIKIKEKSEAILLDKIEQLSEIIDNEPSYKKELEYQIKSFEKIFKHFEAEKVNYEDKISELTETIENFKVSLAKKSYFDQIEQLTTEFQNLKEDLEVIQKERKVSQPERVVSRVIEDSPKSSYQSYRSPVQFTETDSTQSAHSKLNFSNRISSQSNKSNLGNSLNPF